MKYALNLAGDGRVLSVTFSQFAPAGAVQADALPEGDITEYRYAEGAFLHEPPAAPEPAATQLDRIEAQLAYTAMMTETMLESEG